MVFLSINQCFIDDQKYNNVVMRPRHLIRSSQIYTYSFNPYLDTSRLTLPTTLPQSDCKLFSLVYV